MTLQLKYYHDFTGNSDYELPYVLVYRGFEVDLMDIGLHLHKFCKDPYVEGLMTMVSTKNGRHIFTQPFHFKSKADAALCRLTF